MKITDEAVEAAARVLVPVWFGGFEDQSEEGFPGTPNRRAINTARAALEAALPHLSQGEVRVSDEIVDRIAESVYLQEGGDDWLKLPGRYRTQQRKLVRQVLAAIDIVQRSILSALSPAPVGVTDGGQLPTRTEARNAELQQEVDADASAMAWGAELKSAEARNLELEADLEVANDKLRKMAGALEPFTEVAFDEHADLPDNTVVVIKHEKLLDVTFTLGDFRRARAVLGDQSNE